MKPYYKPSPQDCLAHYGVKGMKWGVRRYQNYDGSYTRKGLERYRKAESDYERAKSKAAETKAAHKSGQATRQQVKDANRAVKTEKRRMEDAYGKLKTDKLAGEGKKLYQRGKTITGNTRTASSWFLCGKVTLIQRDGRPADGTTCGLSYRSGRNNRERFARWKGHQREQKAAGLLCPLRREGQ